MSDSGQSALTSTSIAPFLGAIVLSSLLYFASSGPAPPLGGEPLGRWGGKVATITAMPLPVAPRTMSSIALTTAEISVSPAPFSAFRSLAPSIRSITSGRASERALDSRSRPLLTDSPGTPAFCTSIICAV